MTELQYGENDILALNGKQFSMLNDKESKCLKFYREQGRKYGIQISIVSNASADALNSARSKQQADDVLKSADSVITVTKNAI